MYRALVVLVAGILLAAAAMPHMADRVAAGLAQAMAEIEELIERMAGSDEGDADDAELHPEVKRDERRPDGSG